MLKEKMNVKINSTKEFIAENKDEILVGILLGTLGVTTCVLGAALVKSEIGKKILEETDYTLKDKVDTLEEALTEGVFEEAIATTTRKINYKKDRLSFIRNEKDTREFNKQIISKLEREINILTERRDAFEKAQASVGIGDD